MKSFLRLIIAVLSVWYITPVRASHIEAGDLTYQCIGPHQYLVTLNLYRDCNGIALPDTARISYSSASCGVSSSIILNLDTPVVNVTDTCPGHNSACHGGSGFGVERHTYTGVLNLPAGCGTDWVLSFRNCARNAAITTINNPGNTCFYIKATLNNTLPLCDHSPTFLKDPVAFTCLGQLDQLNQGGYDSDGDSLVYSLVASESAANTSVVYLGGYSAANPLSVTGTFGFNTATGQMTFTPNSTQVGIMKVLVSEYRGGVLIGTVERDMQVVVQNCSDSVPQLSNVNTTSGSATMLSSASVVIPPCTTGCFTFASATTNADTSIHLTVTWTGQNNVPGATFTTTSGRTPTATVCWTPGRNNAGSHNIYVTVKDNACPNPGQATKTYTILVPQVYPAGRDTTICQYNVASTRGTDTAAGSWVAMSTNPVATNILTPSQPITIITGFSVAGRYNYIWTESNGGCGDTMSVFVTAKPNAGADQTICQYGTLTMTATGSGRWTALLSNPVVTTIADSSSSTTTITGFTVQGIYNYVWTSNGCTDTISVTVTTKPNAGPDQTICGSTGFVMMAATGSGIWTAAATNPAVTTITVPASPATMVTGLSVSGTYTYYWGYGCNDTVQINVSIQPDGGPDQSICQGGAATMAATGAGTWTALASNPATTVIANSSSGTTGITGFTTAGVYGYLWSLGGTCVDTVRITVTALPNAGPDQTLCQYNIATMAATGTGTWSALATNPATTTISSSTSATTTVSGLSIAGVYYYVWAQNTCTDTMKITVTAKPNAGPDQTTCQYSTATMAATGSGSWTAASGNPAAVSFANNNSATTNVSGLSAAGTYTLIWSSGGCSDTALVTVNAKPNAGSDQTLCQYTSTLMAATGTGTWSAAAANPATVVITTATLATTSVGPFATAGTYTFYWTNNGCSDTVRITVNAKPNAGPDQTTCQYSTATMAATGAGAWTAAGSNPAVVSFGNATSPTTVVSGFNTAGTYTLYWTNNGCSDTVLITVNAKPNAGSDQTLCQYSTATMSATGTGVWSPAVSNPATVVITNTTLATTSVGPFATAGAYTFYWTNNGCSDTMQINVSAKPNAGPDQSLCAPGSIVTAATGAGVWSALSTNPGVTVIVTPSQAATTISGFSAGGNYSYVWNVNGCTDTMSVFVTPVNFAGPDQTTCQYSSVTTAAFGSGVWSQPASNPVTASVASSTADTTTISGLSVPGVYSFIWTNSLCADTMQVTVMAKPDAGADQNICQYNTINTAASGAGAWSALLGNPATVSFSSITSAATSVSGFTVAGSYALIWSAGGCSDTMVVMVTAKPDAGADQTICQYTNAIMAATGTGTWTALATNPAAVSFSSVTSATATVSGFSAAGSYVLLWSSGGCADTVVITVTAKPDAGTDQTFCLPGSILTDASGAGTWTALSNNPAASNILSPTSPVTTISGFSAGGTYSYVWTVNGCTDTMGVYIIPLSPAGPDQATCQYSTATATAFGIGGSWAALAGNPATTTFANAADDTTVISGFAVAGVYGYVWTVNGCADTMYVTVTAKPDAGADQTICQFSTTVMTATGSGTWSAAAGNPATVTFANVTAATSVVSGFAVAGTYTFYWSNNGCVDTVSITVTAKPDAGADQTICEYNVVTLSAAGTGVWTAAAGNPAVVSFTNANAGSSVVSGFASAGAYALYWSNNGCTDTVLINVTAKPDAGPDQTVCQNSTATMAAIGTGTWTAAPGNPAVATIAPATSATASVTGLSATGAYTFYWSNGGCTDTMMITVVPSGAVSVSPTAICLGQPAVLTAQVTVPGGSYSWSTGVAVDTLASVTVSPAGSTTYTVTYTLPVCGAYTASALVTVYPPLTLTQMNDTICTGSSATLTATPTTIGGTYAWTPGGNTNTSITVAPAAQAVYTATYSLAGCLPVSVSDTVFVTVPPTVSVNDTTVCAGNAATLAATASQAGGTYAWSPGGQATAAITVTPLTTSTYTVSYAIPLSVCPAVTATGTVTVTPQPALTLHDTAVCDGHSALLTAAANISGGSWQWNPVGATTPSVTVSPTATTTYSVSYTVPDCGTATGTETVTVNANPTVTIKPNDITCYGYTNGYITATVSPSGTYQYLWSDGSSMSADSGLAAGSYSLQVTDANGCTAAAAPVTIAAPAQAYAQVMPGDTTVLQGNDVQLASVFTGYAASAVTGYSWSPIPGLSCTDCPAPMLNTTDATDTLNVYTITIMYNNGCIVTASDTIRVETGVAAGDAFTPNGDGKNDTFYILARGVAEYHMTIYNRWGQLVYESTDSSAGWDGTYKGQPQASEVYSYFVSITFKNGQQTAKTGTVTLIR